MNIDDPVLTAYALHELPSADERAEVETWLAGHAEGRALVDETRKMAALLKGKLQPAGTAPRLTDAQRAAILRSCDGEMRSCDARDGDTPPRSCDAFVAEGGSGAIAASERVGDDGVSPTFGGEGAAATGKIRRVRFTVAALTALAACLAFGPLLLESGKPKESLPLLAQSGEKKRVDLTAATALPAPAQTPLPASTSEILSGNAAAAAPSAPSTGRVAQAASGAAETRREQPILPASQPGAAGGTASISGGLSKNKIGGPFQPRSAPASVPSRSSNYALADADRSDDLSRSRDPSNTAAYDAITENPFLLARENPLSTFSIDVDTASYANLRRFLNEGQLPPRGAVRIEEMLNYFSYDYPAPTGDTPFSTNMEVSECPWQPEHRLVRIGLRGRDVPPSQRPAGNLVFLIDVSGSMQPADRLPLLKQSLRLLVDQLGPEDKVAIAVYAGSSGLVLPATSDKERIRTALDRLEAGGSTNGAAGIQLAYQVAAENFIPGGTNRVVLATDGDFNVGITSQSDLVDLIHEKAKTGVFLSVLGFGRDNLKDSTMEKLADQGNGNYAYIDSLYEGRKVLVEQIGGTLCTIAKDVKMQIEFNPALVSAYRLIGYENRMLRKEDFNDDQKDAGDIGANHTVTAFYEIVPVGSLAPVAGQVDALKYSQNSVQLKTAGATLPTGDMLTLKLRYKQPAGDTSSKLEIPLVDQGGRTAQASADFRFAAAVAEAGLLLRQSENKELAAWDSAIALASSGLGEDRNGYRREFLELLRKAKALSNREG